MKLTFEFDTYFTHFPFSVKSNNEKAKTIKEKLSLCQDLCC
jgi:hypothetical protein